VGIESEDQDHQTRGDMMCGPGQNHGKRKKDIEWDRKRTILIKGKYASEHSTWNLRRNIIIITMIIIVIAMIAYSVIAVQYRLG